MSVQDDLDKLRVAFPGCTMVAFADLGARIVLVSSSAETARRDVLDGLSRSAVSAFDFAARAGVPAADLALQCTAGQVEIYLRDPARPDDALCAHCTVAMDLDGFLSAARSALSALAGEGDG